MGIIAVLGYIITDSVLDSCSFYVKRTNLIPSVKGVMARIRINESCRFNHIFLLQNRPLGHL